MWAACIEVERTEYRPQQNYSRSGLESSYVSFVNLISRKRFVVPWLQNESAAALLKTPIQENREHWRALASRFLSGIAN
jgi:hypothetical protein